MRLRGRFLRVCMRPLPVSFSLLSKVQMRGRGDWCEDIRVTDTGTVLSAPILCARSVKRDGTREWDND